MRLHDNLSSGNGYKVRLLLAPSARSGRRGVTWNSSPSSSVNWINARSLTCWCLRSGCRYARL